RVAPPSIDGERALRVERLETPLREVRDDAPPSLRPDDILWWTRDTSTWVRRYGVVVEVRITAPDAFPGR
ncbi:MAG: hypothetical protein KDA21_06705, partial [Phycisphaerales bacterium]|nr:hypothetical protein [Phycisphaerales bacterium]